MAAAASTTENEFPKEQSLGEHGDDAADKPQKSEKRKPKVGIQTANQIHIEEKNFKPRTKTAPKRKSNKKGRMTKKLLGQRRNHNLQHKSRMELVKKSSRTRTGNARFRRKKKSPLNLYINGYEEASMSNCQGKSQPFPIPLVIPSPKPQEDVDRSSVKYTLQRAESNRVHQMRVMSNKRRFGRRNRSTMRKMHFRRKYFAGYWREPEVRLDDLSSLDCGSYSDNVEELSTTEEAGKTEDLFPLTIPADFVFNIHAPEFIPKGTNKKRANVFTVSELMESLKGQKLPKMPDLESSFPQV